MINKKIQILLEATLKKEKEGYVIVLPDFSQEVIVEISNKKLW